MCGWLSWATARASRRKRSSWSVSAAMSRCISLIATRRSRVASKARYTVDIPPAPTWASSRYRPLSGALRLRGRLLGLARLLGLRDAGRLGGRRVDRALAERDLAAGLRLGLGRVGLGRCGLGRGLRRRRLGGDELGLRLRRRGRR